MTDTTNNPVVEDADDGVNYIDLDTLNEYERAAFKDKLELRQLVAETEQAEAEALEKTLAAADQERKRAFRVRGVTDGVFELSDAVSGAIVDYLTERIEAFVEHYQDDDDKPGIEFIIHSPGGEVFSGWKLFDTLRAASLAGHEVTTKVRGFAASMGSVLAQAGDVRVVGPESWTMLHEPSSISFGKSSQMMDEAKFMERLKKQMIDVYSRKSGNPPATIKKWLERKDFWLTAQEAVDRGLADRIG